MDQGKPPYGKYYELEKKGRSNWIGNPAWARIKTEVIFTRSL
jgi:hypothetical protein